MIRKVVALTIVVGFVVAPCLAKPRDPSYKHPKNKLFIEGNTVTPKIASGDVCYCKRGVKDVVDIHCDSGRVFKNVGHAESAITGTPGHIMHANYIGFRITKSSTPGLIGSGKRMDYWVQE